MNISRRSSCTSVKNPTHSTPAGTGIERSQGTALLSSSSPDQASRRRKSFECSGFTSLALWKVSASSALTSTRRDRSGFSLASTASIRAASSCR